MKEKNSYFGSIFERSKTRDLPRPVNNFVLSQLNYPMSRKADEGLESSVTDVENIDESYNNPVASRHTGKLSGKNTSDQESVSPLETVHNNSTKEETVLETATEKFGENIKEKSKNRAKSIEPLKEKGGSINFQSSYPAYQSEKNPDNQFKGTHQLKVDSGIQEPVRPYSIMPASSNHGSNSKKEEQDIELRKGEMETFELTGNSTMLPRKQPDNDMKLASTSQMKTNRHDASGLHSINDIIEIVPINDEVTEKETRKTEEKVNYPATAHADQRLANKITSTQYEKKKDEPSLVIKNINIQIVDNKRTLPAQIKKINHTENDVLGRSYLWSFNIS